MDFLTQLVDSLTIKDGKYLGLGAAKGRIVFDDDATDLITFSDCNVNINGELTVAGGAAFNEDSAEKRRSLLDIDHLQHSALQGGAYIGRTRVRESHFDVSNVGTTWGSLTSSTTSEYKAAMSSDGKIIVLAINSNKPEVSVDGGTTWTQYGSAGMYFGAACSADGQVMMLTEIGTGLIVCSYDFGLTWATKKSSTGTGIRYCAMSSDGRVMTAIVQGGYIFVSVDFGENWSQVAASKNWTGVCMSSDGKYMMACANDGSAEYIYVSSDYGSVWTAVTGAGAASWSQAKMSSDGRIMVTSRAAGRIYMSYDYGATWTSKDTSDRTWREFAMSENGQIIVGCDNNYVFISTDYGATWSQTTRTATSSQALMVSSDGKMIVLGVNSTTKYVSYADSVVKGNLSASGNVTASGNVSVGKRLLGAKGADIASANDITLGDGNYFEITGTTTINRILTTGWTAGSFVTLRVTTSLTIAHNVASGSGYAGILITQIGTDFMIAEETLLTLVYNGTNWIIVSYASAPE